MDVVWILDDREHPAMTINVSLGGMFIRSEEQPPFRAIVQVRFHVPALRQDITVDGHVRWVEKIGFGIQFIGLRAIEVWGMNQLFKNAPLSRT